MTNRTCFTFEVFEKRTQKMPKHVLDSCKDRLARFRRAMREEED